MRRLSLEPYGFVVPGTKEEQPYDVISSVVALLTHPGRQLGVEGILSVGRIVDKVRNANGSVLLEESEYTELLAAVNSFRGYSLGDIELVKRVQDAPTVNVAEK